MSAGIPCRCCGAATDMRLAWHPDLTPAGRSIGRKYEVGVCDDCEALRPGEPGSAVRAALRLLGKAEGDWPLAAEAFEEAGVDVSPLLYDSQSRPAAQRKAWGHVTRGDRAQLRKGYARLLDLRVHAAADRDRPVPPHPPPDEYPRGCLACGVGASAQWYSVTTGALTRGPGLVTGCVCDACAPALREAGAVGQSFIERAAMRHLGLEWSEAVRIPGLQAWAATGLPPRTTPWDWVDLREPEPDLDPLTALRADVAALRSEVAALRGEAGR